MYTNGTPGLCCTLRGRIDNASTTVMVLPWAAYFSEKSGFLAKNLQLANPNVKRYSTFENIYIREVRSNRIIEKEIRSSRVYRDRIPSCCSLHTHIHSGFPTQTNSKIENVYGHRFVFSSYSSPARERTDTIRQSYTHNLRFRRFSGLELQK